MQLRSKSQMSGNDVTYDITTDIAQSIHSGDDAKLSPKPVGAQTATLFQDRNPSMPADIKKARKSQKNPYEGMNKEQIRHAKKERRQRKEWQKYKEKLQAEREEVAKQFRSNYYWNSYTTQHTKPRDDGNASPKNITASSHMHLKDPKYS